MHEYTPPRSNKAGIWLPALMFAGAALCLICSALGIAYRLAWQLTMAVLLICGIQLTTRYLLQTYTYVIRSGAVSTFEDEFNRISEVTGEADELWLRIVRTQGKKSDTIAGFPLTSVVTTVKGGRGSLDERAQGVRHSFNFCNTLFSKESYTVLVSINGELLSVTLEPDEYILSQLDKSR